jgi:glycosidase
MVDRFLDGNPTNNKPIHDPKLHDLANFMGGDFAGIQEKIKDGYFNDLGVNTLWISPIQKQPDSSWVEWIPPNRTFSGYHGYWPVSPRKTDLRFGSNEEFQSVVQNAHRTNTKVILDFVSNHVHQNHPYYKEFPKWFGDVNLTDGRINIRQWDGDTRLTTWFDEFIPSFDFPSAPGAIDQVVEDALWWMEEYDLDGFRQDAVKHVPHSFWRSLTQSARKRFPEKNIYQIGETFGSDDLIGSYVNPAELDGQFNFSIYFNARGPFSSNKADFSDLGRIIEENRHSFGPIHLMGNITSSHDQFRFTGYADGQMKLSDNGTARSFDDPVGKIRHKSTYSKLANFHAFNISQPGVPIIYYGEEIAMMGEGDPGNRRMMRFDLSEKEADLKNQFSQLNKLRVKYPSLAVGDQIILLSDGPVFATFKVYFDEKVLVMINQSPKNEIVNIKLPISVESLKNCLSDNSVIIKDNSIQLTLKPYSHSFYYAN